MPLDRIAARLRHRIPATAWAAFLSCFLSGYLIHLFAFTNLIPNSDGLSRVFDPQQMTVSGRWFLHYASALNSFTQMPALIGFLSIVFLSLAAAAAVLALGLHSRTLSALAGVLMAAFPCLGYTFLYMFTASAYCLAILLAVLVISWKGAEMDPLLLFKDAGNMATFAADFFPPDFSQWQDYLSEMAVTLQIAVWGTALAVILSIPFGLMSAENIVPWWIYQPMRRLMDACRAINEMVFAMLFVVAVGLGPFAGVMALFIHTTGVLSKLLSEAVEAIEPGPVEGIRATGANKIEEILYGVLPQVMPLLISYSLYRFESNVRSATVVGMVGAGGIGVTLWEAIRGFQFQQTCALMVLIIVTVSLLDFLSQRLRKHFI